jgi:hypothetical protein
VDCTLARRIESRHVLDPYSCDDRRRGNATPHCDPIVTTKVPSVASSKPSEALESEKAHSCSVVIRPPIEA